MNVLEKIEAVKLKKKHCSIEEKHNYYQAWRKSGLSQTQFCKENNLPIQTFSSWVRQTEKGPVPRMSFVPLQVVPKEKIDVEKIEIQFSNGVMCRMTDVSDTKKVVTLVKELHDAFVTDSK